MQTILYRIICLIIGYIFGLFQTGYIYGKMNNIDIRDYGSGNAGTTNAMRILGKKAGLITFLGDALKGVFCGLFVRAIFGLALGLDASCLFILCLYSGFGVVLGHNYPFYMNFKGGKGIAATGGVIVSLFDWKLVIIVAVTFFSITFISKYVSLGSICMVTVFFGCMVAFSIIGWLPISGSDQILEACIMAFLFSSLAIYKHRGNIVRLINGTERKIGEKKENA